MLSYCWKPFRYLDILEIFFIQIFYIFLVTTEKEFAIVLKMTLVHALSERFKKSDKWQQN